jgi:hypothetical protein
MFAGLAPGLIGFYQMDVRIPMDARAFFSATCTLPEDASFAFYMATTGQP